MTYVIVGLGNPGEEYERSRHNTGRIILDILVKKWKFTDWEKDKRLGALVANGDVAGEDVLALEPETFMNRSGNAVKKLITSRKKAERLIVIHDDIDLPLGRLRLSKGRGSGGHKGIDSIARMLNTNGFIRIRVGVSPKVRGSNKPKKPAGEKKVLDFLMGDFRKAELITVEVLARDIKDAIECIIEDGLDVTMNEFNQIKE